MNGIAALRKELCDIIGIMPEYKLYALRPLLDVLVDGDGETDDPHFVIETDLTDEERAIIAAGEEEWEKHPETFISLDALIAKRRRRIRQKKCKTTTL